MHRCGGRRGIVLPAATLAQGTPRNERWDPGYEPPMTAAGHPDLGGNWTNVTITPFQREEGLEPFYTWEEVARPRGPSRVHHRAASSTE